MYLITILNIVLWLAWLKRDIKKFVFVRHGDHNRNPIRSQLNSDRSSTVNCRETVLNRLEINWNIIQKTKRPFQDSYKVRILFPNETVLSKTIVTTDAEQTPSKKSLVMYNETPFYWTFCYGHVWLPWTKQCHFQ